MFPCTIITRVRSFVFILLLSLTHAYDRKITSELNPGCQSNLCNSTYTTLVHVRAIGSHDTIHQLWDFTRSTPTFIFAVAGVNSTLNITWAGIKPIEFNLSENPKYSFALVFDKLYEYDDLKDVGHIDKDSPTRSHDLQDLSWHRTAMVVKEDEASLMIHGRRSSDPKDSLIGVTLDLLPYKDYAADLPHLIHTANSTLIDFTLKDQPITPSFNSSRFAWHVVLASTDAASDLMHCAMRKSLDDEHTPGVFEIYEIKTPAVLRGGSGGFMQFRPVAYTEPGRGVSTSTIAHVSPFTRTSLPERSTVEKFYRNVDKEDLLVEDIFVSFGETGDGFYRKHNYTAWSFTVGYGTPPVEGFSLFVILVISIGLGVPVLLALSGVVYLVSRRCKQRNEPRRFSNVD